MLRLLVSLVIPRMLRKWRRHERGLGYRLRIADLPPGWLPGQVPFDLTDTWRAGGLRVNGMHYFTLGDVENGLTVRFQKDNELYQAWLGGYVVQLEDSREWSVRDYLKLSELDQKMWLRCFGDPAPAMDFGEVTETGEFTSSGYRGVAYTWKGKTHNDIGKGSRRFFNRLVMEGMAYLMTLLNPGFSLVGRNFIPPRPQRGERSYAETELHGCGAVVHLEPKVKAVLYACKVVEDPGLPDLLSHVEIRKV
jgi:hypothetical protein